MKILSQIPHTKIPTRRWNDIEVLILKGNLHEYYERELWKEKFICLIGHKSANTTDASFMKPRPISLYKILFLLIFSLRKFLAEAPFPVRFLKISASETYTKFPYFTQRIQLWRFCWKHCFEVLQILTNFSITKDFSWLLYNKYWNVEILTLNCLSMYVGFFCFVLLFFCTN